MSIYIVEISGQLLNVLLQLIRCLQAILEETGREQKDIRISLDINSVFPMNVRQKSTSISINDHYENVRCYRVLL